MTDTNHDQSTALAADDVEAQAASDETVDDSLESQVEEGNPTNPTIESDELETVDSQEENEEDDDDAMVPLSKLKKVRNEAKNLRDRLKVAEDRVVELEAREGDEALVRERDDLKSQLETLVNQNRQTKLEALVTKAAETANAIQPEAIVHLIDSSKVEWEDDAPKNIDALVVDVKNNYSRLFGTTAKGNAGNRNERNSEHEGLTPTQRMKSAFENN
ncbi:MAG: phage scaffolding protein [Thermomicrobiales bacterium]